MSVCSDCALYAFQFAAFSLLNSSSSSYLSSSDQGVTFTYPQLFGPTRLPPTMPLLCAVTLWYRHPGRKAAVLRGYVGDIPNIVQTHNGDELSLGPVEFFTDFGGCFSGAKQHGGWNVTGESVWFAFNCRGAGHKLWKISFYPKTGGTFTGKHPYLDGVEVTADLESATRWRVHVPLRCSIGERLRATRSSGGQLDRGFMPATEGEEFTVLYVGEKGDEEAWVYVEGDAQRGWIQKTCFEEWDCLQLFL